MPKGIKGFQKEHKQFDSGKTQFKKGHKTNSGKHWKIKDTSNMKKSKLQHKRKPYQYPEGTKKKPMTKITKEKIKDKLRGKNTGKNGSNWKGGISKLNKIIRDRYEYHQWVSFCMTRDNWVCQTCQNKGGILQVHHKKSFALILKENNIKTIEEAINCKELWDTDNGVTLCLDCHKQTETYLKNIIIREVKG